MGDNYLDTFDTRGDLYNEASLINSRAREIERQILIDLLAMRPDYRVCDAPAGGGYLADGLRDLVKDTRQIICVEPSEKFSEAIDPAYIKHIAPLDLLPMKDESIDRVGSLAGLHHLADKSRFFHEAFRTLKSDGLFAVGDVLEGTPVAKFLNGPVDAYTETGHRGIFLREGECAQLLTSAGFEDAREDEWRFPWVFQTHDQMVKYCKRLFGMVKATESQVAAAITSCFAVEESNGEVKLPWSLVYGVGVKL